MQAWYFAGEKIMNVQSEDGKAQVNIGTLGLQRKQIQTLPATAANNNN